MRKQAIKVMTFALAVCMVIGGACLCAGPEVSAAEKSQAAIDEIAGQIGDPSEDPFDYTRKADARKALSRAAALPDKFDLRNVNGTSYVTPIKFQNPFGNCWGFAAIAAAETSILGDQELRGDYVADIRKAGTGLQLDLSEKQLTYFARTPINDPKNPQNGEGDAPILLNPDDDPVAAAYDMGGFATTATSMFAAGVGPVLESENTLFEYRGKNGMIQKDWVDGAFQNYEYSAQDDWALDESLRFSHSFSLGESYIVPSPAKIEAAGFDNKYEFNENGVAAIKDQLYHYRGVQIGYQDDNFVPPEDHGNYINSKFAHYTYSPQGPRHAVCIVGWDDNYSRENFRHEVDPNDEGITEENTVPPGDGAWLVKNSWGSGEEVFPNRGDGSWGIVDEATGKHTGYFWLSYYDQSIATPEALDFEPEAESDRASTDSIDQHDLMPISKYLAAHVDSKVSTANIFKASSCEEIRKVSCQTTYPGTEVTFELYLLAENFESPTDGMLMDTVTSSFEYGGFHKVALNKPFTVMRGQSYAIVVTQKVPADSGEQYAAGVNLGNGKAVINKGESFIFTDGKWQDLSQKKLRKKLIGKVKDREGSDAMDNFPIKGYGKKKADVILEVKYNGMLSLPEEGSDEEPAAFFKAWYTDSTGSGDAINVMPKWEVPEGGDGVIELIDGRDVSRKTLKCKRLGRDYLVVTAEGIGQVIYRIEVRPWDPETAKVKTGKKSIKISLKVRKQEGLSGFEVSYRVKGAAKWKTKKFGASTKTIKLTGLKSGKQYQVKIRSFAESAYGRMYSDWVKVKTK